MSENSPVINRGMVLKVGGAAAGAILAEILGQQPGDAYILPINMSASAGNGNIQSKSNPGCPPYQNVTVYIWDDEPPKNVPLPKSPGIIFDNRGKTGGGMVQGYYGDAAKGEGGDFNAYNPQPHPQLTIVIVAS